MCNVHTDLEIHVYIRGLILKFFNYAYVASLIISAITVFPALGQAAEYPEFQSWNEQNYRDIIKSGHVGGLTIYATPEVANDTKVYLIDKQKRFSNRSNFVVGNISIEKGYSIALFPGGYDLLVLTKEKLFSKAINRSTSLVIEGGKTIVARVDNKGIFFEEGVGDKNINVDYGSIFFSNFINSELKATVDIFNQKLPTIDDEGKLRVVITNAKDSLNFSVNGTPATPANSKHIGKNSVEYLFIFKLNDGENLFIATAAGIDGQLQSRTYRYFKKSAAELENERLAKQKQETDRLARIEAERRAKIAEEDRIAREGDGSPDDIQCKRYGLKPQTQGYAECRMRLDLARKEAAQRIDNQNRQIAAQQELLRQQEQNAANARAARESQCRFVQSAEYSKPTMGGFLESMQRANAAFDNCMNGVPTINTTCSRDAFGSVNCTSR